MSDSLVRADRSELGDFRLGRKILKINGKACYHNIMAIEKYNNNFWSQI